MIALCAFESNQEFRGTDAYARNLIEALAQIDNKHKYIVFTNNEKPYLKLINNANMEVVRIDLDSDQIQTVNSKHKSLSSDLLWLHSDLYSWLDKYHVKVLHTLGYIGLIYKRAECNIRIVATAHGMEHEHASDMFRPEMVHFLQKSVPQSFRTADRIIAVSNNVKNEAQILYGIDADKIDVVHHGISDDFRKQYPKEIEQEPYILYVGSSEQRKNVATVIQGFACYKKKAESKLKLMLVGGEFREYEQLIDDFKIKEDVVIRGFLTKEELVRCYQNAFVFVCLSVYEGFGLVVAEAMTCSVPMILSNIPIFYEVVKGAGVMIDPYDYNALAQQLERLYNDSELYQKLKKNVQDMKNEYTIRKMAQETIHVYEKLLEDKTLYKTISEPKEVK